jgi:hypothetical protein
MIAAWRETAGASDASRNVAAFGAAGWLSLAAAPTFAIMALLTGILEGGAPDICSAQVATPLERNGPDVFADERLPFGALAEAGRQPAKRCTAVPNAAAGTEKNSGAVVEFDASRTSIGKALRGSAGHRRRTIVSEL